MSDSIPHNHLPPRADQTSSMSPLNSSQSNVGKSASSSRFPSEAHQDSLSGADYVYEIPAPVLAHVFSFVEIVDVLSLEQTTTYIMECISGQHLWEHILEKNCENGLRISNRRAKNVIRRILFSDQGMVSTIRSVADRAEESPSNTLGPSRCYLEIKNKTEGYFRAIIASRTGLFNNNEDYIGQFTPDEVQEAMCGCGNARSCYWSSKQSMSQEGSEFIEYEITPNSVLFSVSVTPYRAYWHPTCPTYGPRQVSVSIFQKSKIPDYESTQQNKSIYDSPVYDCENEMEEQTFAFSKPVFAPGECTLRINFIGYVQAQTLEVRGMQVTQISETSPRVYYICISHAKATGISL